MDIKVAAPVKKLPAKYTNNAGCMR